MWPWASARPPAHGAPPPHASSRCMPGRHPSAMHSEIKPGGSQPAKRMRTAAAVQIGVAALDAAGEAVVARGKAIHFVARPALVAGPQQERVRRHGCAVGDAWGAADIADSHESRGGVVAPAKEQAGVDWVSACAHDTSCCKQVLLRELCKLRAGSGAYSRHALAGEHDLQLGAHAAAAIGRGNRRRQASLKFMRISQLSPERARQRGLQPQREEVPHPRK